MLGGGFGSMFNDQFFRDPFLHMNQMMSSFGMGQGFNDPFFNDPFFNLGRAQQPQPRLAQRSAAPVQIEEVHDDDEQGHGGRDNQPIVEEPDDDPAQKRTRTSRYMSPPRHARGGVPQQQQQQQQTVGFPGLFNFPNFNSMSNMGGNCYSYSSSSFQSYGPNGLNYHATNNSRSGPEGVRESQATVRDGRTGEQKMRIARGAGERERILTRLRDARGREEADEILKGIEQEEADKFDREWQEQAERNLMNPGIGSRLGYAPPAARHSSYAQPNRPALGGAPGGPMSTTSNPYRGTPQYPVHQQGATGANVAGPASLGGDYSGGSRSGVYGVGNGYGQPGVGASNGYPSALRGGGYSTGGTAGLNGRNTAAYGSSSNGVSGMDVQGSGLHRSSSRGTSGLGAGPGGGTARSYSGAAPGAIPGHSIHAISPGAAPSLSETMRRPANGSRQFEPQ